MTDQDSAQSASFSDSSEPVVLPSGAIVQTDSGATKPGSATVSRRALLTGIGISAVTGLAVGAGIAGPIAYHRGKSTAGAGTGGKRHINLVFGGDVCDAPAIVAKEKGFFADAGLDVSLHRTVGDEDIKAAVGSGQSDGRTREGEQHQSRDDPDHGDGAEQHRTCSDDLTVERQPPQGWNAEQVSQDAEDRTGEGLQPGLGQGHHA